MTFTKEGGFLVHRTAQIGTGAVLRGSGKIGANVKVGDYVVIEGNVEIGDATQIGHHTVIAGRTFIGRGNRFSAFCCIGAAPQHAIHDPQQSVGFVSIGDFNVFREYTAVYMPVSSDNTTVGNHCYIMAHSNIDHDVAIADHVKIASGCAISGYVRVDRGVDIGLHTAIHQRLHIGMHSMIGMGTPVMKNVLPYSTIIQQSFTKVNERGLVQHDFSKEVIRQIVNTYQRWAIDGDLPNGLLEVHEDSALRPIADFSRTHGQRCYRPSLALKDAISVLN